MRGKRGGERRWHRTFLVQPLAIEGLAEAPARISTAEGFETNRLFFVCPLSIVHRRGRGLNAAKRGASRGCVLCGEQGRLNTFQEDLVVNACLGAAAEGDISVHKVGILSCPLETLSCAHRP